MEIADWNREQLLAQFPLWKGEKIVSELVARLIEEGEPGESALLVITRHRIGLQHYKLCFFRPLYCVQGLCIEGQNLSLGLHDQTLLQFRAEDAAAVASFFRLLVGFRYQSITPDAQQAMTEGCRLFSEGNHASAIESFSRAGELETFHPGPAILLGMLMWKLGRGREAADQVEKRWSEIIALYPDRFGFWSSLPFGPIHFFKHSIKWNIHEPYDELNMGQLMLVGLAAVHQHNADLYGRALTIALKKIAESPADNMRWIDFWLAMSGPEHAQAFQNGMDGFAKAMEQAGEGQKIPDEFRNLLSNFRELCLKLIGYRLDPTGTSHAAIDLSEPGHRRYDFFHLRTLERWGDILDCPQLPEPDCKQILEELLFAPDSFGSLLDWAQAHCDNGITAERAWAHLRLGQPKDASHLLAMNPQEFYDRIANGFHHRNPQVWLAAVVCAELLLDSNSAGEAQELLDRAYKDCIPSFGTTDDIYTLHASKLLGLYSALAQGNVAGCRIYSRLLESEKGFSWVWPAVLRLRPELKRFPESHDHLVENLDEFTNWLGSNLSPLRSGSTDALRIAEKQYEEARCCSRIRVVVGGETSAGKSSFINALLGHPILFVTQEEATAAPTTVTRGIGWAAYAYDHGGGQTEQIELGPEIDDTSQKILVEFVRCHTSLASPESTNVGSLRITAPIENLASDIDYIDTPGLNAHSLRTVRAKEAIESAHVCIFVLDAATALKAGEMRKITWAAEAVAKTIFVINKMDRVVGDDDLDVDLDSTQAVLNRVHDELVQAIGTSELNLYPVCSLTADQLRIAGASPKAIQYVENIAEVRAKLQDLIHGSKDRLIAQYAAKAARLLAQEAYEQSTLQIARCEQELGRLSIKQPASSDSFRNDAAGLLSTIWLQHRNDYLVEIGQKLEKVVKYCKEKIGNSLDGRQTANRLNIDFNGFLADVDKARREQWKKFGQIAADVLEQFFNGLCEGTHFTMTFSSEAMLAQAVPMPLVDCLSNLQEDLSNLTNFSASLKKGAAQVIGGAIGFVIANAILPGWGSVIGIGIGNKIGSEIDETRKKDIRTNIDAQFKELYGRVTNVIESDMAEGGSDLPPILQAVDSVVNEECGRFELMLSEEIRRLESELAIVRNDAAQYRDLMVNAHRWVESFESPVYGGPGEAVVCVEVEPSRKAPQCAKCNSPFMPWIGGVLCWKCGWPGSVSQQNETRSHGCVEKTRIDINNYTPIDGQTEIAEIIGLQMIAARVETGSQLAEDRRSFEEQAEKQAMTNPPRMIESLLDSPERLPSRLIDSQWLGMQNKALVKRRSTRKAIQNAYTVARDKLIDNLHAKHRELANLWDCTVDDFLREQIAGVLAPLIRRIEKLRCERKAQWEDLLARGRLEDPPADLVQSIEPMFPLGFATALNATGQAAAFLREWRLADGQIVTQRAQSIYRIFVDAFKRDAGKIQAEWSNTWNEAVRSRIAEWIDRKFSEALPLIQRHEQEWRHALEREWHDGEINRPPAMFSEVAALPGVLPEFPGLGPIAALRFADGQTGQGQTEKIYANARSELLKKYWSVFESLQMDWNRRSESIVDQILDQLWSAIRARIDPIVEKRRGWFEGMLSGTALHGFEPLTEYYEVKVALPLNIDEVGAALNPIVEKIRSYCRADGSSMMDYAQAQYESRFRGYDRELQEVDLEWATKWDQRLRQTITAQAEELIHFADEFIMAYSQTWRRAIEEAIGAREYHNPPEPYRQLAVLSELLPEQLLQHSGIPLDRSREISLSRWADGRDARDDFQESYAEQRNQLLHRSDELFKGIYADWDRGVDIFSKQLLEEAWKPVREQVDRFVRQQEIIFRNRMNSNELDEAPLLCKILDANGFIPKSWKEFPIPSTANVKRLLRQRWASGAMIDPQLSILRQQLADQTMAESIINEKSWAAQWDSQISQFVQQWISNCVVLANETITRYQEKILNLLSGDKKKPELLQMHMVFKQKLEIKALVAQDFRRHHYFQIAPPTRLLQYHWFYGDSILPYFEEQYQAGQKRLWARLEEIERKIVKYPYLLREMKHRLTGMWSGMRNIVPWARKKAPEYARSAVKAIRQTLWALSWPIRHYILTILLAIIVGAVYFSLTDPGRIFWRDAAAKAIEWVDAFRGAH